MRRRLEWIDFSIFLAFVTNASKEFADLLSPSWIFQADQDMN